MTNPVKIASAPGINRDGTRFESQHYVDGQWCRFQRGKPQKIGGFDTIQNTTTIPSGVKILRGINAFIEDGQNFFHLGTDNHLHRYVFGSGATRYDDRTPAGFVADPDNLWQFDVMFDQVNVISRIAAHAAPNLTNIDNSTVGSIWYGEVTGIPPDPVIDTGVRGVSGGIVVLGPYLFSYGSSGQIGFSGVNDPLTVSDSFVTSQKIVRGLPLRGAGVGPSGLFWSLDSLIRATWVGGTQIFAFDTLAAELSILSSQSVIEYDGVYYWLGVDRMLMYNGVVRDIPNNLNFNFFFDNLNFDHRQKVFAYKVPQFGEIWWCYPRGAATECSHAIIYNVLQNTWYDTELPAKGRSSGIYAKGLRHPIMTTAIPDGNGNTDINEHEKGTDDVSLTGSIVNAIPSHFETSELSMLNAEQASSQSLKVARIEPDFKQSGDMTLEINGRANPRAPNRSSGVFTFADTAATSEEETLKLREVRRLMSFKFSSNVVGGNYEMGSPIAHVDEADGRVQS